ncbi:hypothetical protein CMI37_28785 [Candidatus Pacearchaeota archaeon]|nr:hypothetical protein [Candidatus Pacearchaeota archaeon]
MSIKMVEQRVCDFPGCVGESNSLDCVECGRDFCNAHYQRLPGPNNLQLYLCGNCVIEKLPNVANNLGFKTKS